MTKYDIKGSLVGFTRKTEEEMYELYHNHATTLGFSIRKNTKRREVVTKQIKEQYYVCSFHGDRRKQPNGATGHTDTNNNHKPGRQFLNEEKKAKTNYKNRLQS